MSSKEQIILSVAWFVLAIIAAAVAIVSAIFDMLWLSIPAAVLSCSYVLLIGVTANMKTEDEQ